MTDLNQKSKVFNTSRGWGFWLPVSLIFLAFILWGSAVQNINIEEISFDGLITALPFSFFAAFIVLMVSFLILMFQEQESLGLLYLNVFVLILIIHGTTASIYDMPRYPWVYKVIGMTSHVQEYGKLDLDFGAYFYWPNFFILTGFINAVSGIDSALNYAGWVQVIFNSLYLVAFVFIFKNLSTNWRRTWVAIWLFYISSWVGQDYFAPQGLNYFYYLMVLGITIRWFLQEKTHKGIIWKLGNKFLPNQIEDDRPVVPASASQRPFVLIILISMYFLIVSGHQLTPFMVISGVLTITIFVGHRSNTFFVLLNVILGTWIIYMAWGFVAEHSNLFQRILSIYENLYDSLFIRYNFEDVPKEHWTFLSAGYLLTGGIWLLAFVGSVKRTVNGYRDWIPILLLFSPFVMLFVLSYGGEMLGRIYFFSLPWATYLAAALFIPDELKRYKKYLAALGYIALSTGLFFGLVLSYFGNEKVYNFPIEEINVIQFFYSEAAPGSLLYTPSHLYPSRFVADFNLYKYKSIVNFGEFHTGIFDESEIRLIINEMGDEKYPGSYFLVTSGQLNYIDKYNITPEDAVVELLERLITSGEFEIVKSNSRAVLLKYIGERGEINDE